MPTILHTMSEEQKSNPNFVTSFDLKNADKLLNDLKERGFDISHPPYTVFSAKAKGLSCVLYKSGKLMVQGKEKGPFIEFYLEPEILQTFTHSYTDVSLDKTPRIGIDESGKGDFFGPLCVAGVYAHGQEIADLQTIGVKDSKKLTDRAIITIAKKIRANFAHHIVKINPKKYNELYEQFKNLNRLLAWGHATTIEQLVASTHCNKVIIDQFADESVVISAIKRKKIEIDLTQRHRGEEDLVVAAASILARQTFVEGLEMLSQEYGVELPKGASALVPKAGQLIVSKHGREILPFVAKMHFKTTDLILN
jgi:ribonuclease HIII